ncbi:DUF3857 domain-containing protein [Thermophagus sp. OGC60D27]|uniref:DUF3857 domain-containing protein n=1 Tax=Thermophagus sp. OGC60D27 TaxID=3458415 RepID=UPI0040383CE7
MKPLLSIIFSGLFITTFAKNNETVFSWEKNPVYSEIPDKYAKEKIIGINYDESISFYYNDYDVLEATHVLHRKIRLNNDQAINKFNKISFSMNNVIELMDIGARAIKPDGRIVNFDQNNLKEVKDEKEGEALRIFAIDGIELGDEVEFYFVRKIHPSSFGRTYFQFDYPMLSASFEIISPPNLIYDVKGYNGFPDASHAVLNDERNRFYCSMTDIPLIKEEKYSFLNPRKARIEYRLDYNYARGRSQILTWDDAAQTFYEDIYLNVNQKGIEKWHKEVGPITGTIREKAAQIEEYLKTNIYIQDYHIPQFSDLSFILENKVTSEKGIVKLYANLFKKHGIKHQLVLTSDRSKIKFDKDFQSWNFLNNYLIFLPDIDTYLDPGNIAFRLGCVSGTLTATDGLFVEPVQIGDFHSAIGKIKYIPPSSHKDNYHNMVIDISVDPNSNIVNIENYQGLKGLNGGFMKYYYRMVDKETKTKMLRSFLPSEIPDSEINLIELSDSHSHSRMKDAEFIIHSKVSPSSYLELAGDKLLLKVGLVIGLQAQMYFEQDRKARVETEFNRSYYREIFFKVPDGYKIANPESTVLNVSQKIDDEIVFLFKSDYSYSGNSYKVTIDEYYKRIFADKDQFEGFKNVVNAAADFNKVVLVLEKE